MSDPAKDPIAGQLQSRPGFAVEPVNGFLPLPSYRNWASPQERIRARIGEFAMVAARKCPATEVTTWLKQNFPDSLVYGADLPPCKPAKMYGRNSPEGQYSYRQYLTDFVRIIKPDVLMVDIYPFYHWTTRRDFYACLATIRDVSQKHDIPRFLFVQAMEWTSDKHRPLSESDMRMEVFAALTFGFKGISYFTYDPARDGTSLVDGEGRPRDLFYAFVRRIDTEIAPLGERLKELHSTHVRYVQGGNELPEGLRAYQPDEGITSRIRSIRIVDGNNNRCALLGLFKDGSGRDHFMLTNVAHSAGKTPQEMQVNFVVTFDSMIDTVYRLSRSDGQVESIALTDHQLRLPLPGGTGDLFSFHAAK